MTLLINQECAICQKKSPFKVLYPANFKSQQINEYHFSARRTPDHFHYRLVKCQKCKMVFSTPIFPANKIGKLYQKSEMTYSPEIEDLNKTYAGYLDKALPYLDSKNSFLEIGCGNGFFLKVAQKMGFKRVYGIEPSIACIEKAPNDIRKFIISKMFKKGLFKKNSFDLVCFFHTLDHIVDPNKFLQECQRLLKEDGVILCVTHDVEAISAKLLGERSPIFDIEHTFLFSKQTLRQLFENNGFRVLETSEVLNKYSLAYWFRMLPLPPFMNQTLSLILAKTGFGDLKVGIKAGNIAILAQKINF